MPEWPLPNTVEARKLLDELVSHHSTVGPQPVDRPLVLYGAGKLGRMACELFQRLGIPIGYVMDRSPQGGLLFDAIPVIQSEIAGDSDRETALVAVCVVNAAYEPIRDELASQGWRHILPVYDVLDAYSDRLPMGNGWFAGRLNEEDIANIGEVLAGWSDDWSRAAHIQFLAWRLHRLEWEFRDAPVCIDDRYFIEPICRALGEQERFLDAGAHHGHVSARWLELMQNRFEGIVAVEADSHNARQLKKWIVTLPVGVRDKVLVHECALAAEAGTRPFSHGADLSSRIMPQSDGFVPCHRIDDLGFRFTFGKIHLEGGELEALKGGSETLQRQRPLLAVTIYHNTDGLWRTPRFLMELLPDYRFLMRLHAWCGTGAVMYAIPNERGRAA